MAGTPFETFNTELKSISARLTSVENVREILLEYRPSQDMSANEFHEYKKSILLKEERFPIGDVDLLLRDEETVNEILLEDTNYKDYCNNFEYIKHRLEKAKQMHPLKGHLQTQLEIILSAAIVQDAIAKHPSDPKYPEYPEGKQAQLRAENREFITEFKRGFTAYFGIRDKERKREVQNALAKKTWTISEEKVLLNYDNDKHRTIKMLRLGNLIRLFTALRTIEACALTWSSYKEAWGYHPAVLHITKKCTSRSETEVVPHTEKEKYRIIPLVSILNSALKEQKRIVKEHLLGKKMDLSHMENMPILSRTEIDYFTPYSPNQFSRMSSKIIKEAFRLAQGDNRGNLFDQNFKYKAINYCSMSKGEIHYLLGLIPPDTYARHYCDFTNYSSQHVMLQKLERWASFHAEYPHQPQVKSESIDISPTDENNGTLSVKQFQETPAAANILLTASNADEHDKQLHLSLKTNFGLQGTLTIANGGKIDVS